MPNLVNKILLDDLKTKFTEMGSCLVVSFDTLTVAQANDIRNQFRGAGFRYLVVKNRLACQALSAMGFEMREAFEGKCGVAFAEEEGAISAAKLVREFNRPFRKSPPLRVTGAVIEQKHEVVITGVGDGGVEVHIGIEESDGDCAGIEADRGGRLDADQALPFTEAIDPEIAEHLDHPRNLRIDIRDDDDDISIEIAVEIPDIEAVPGTLSRKLLRLTK